VAKKQEPDPKTDGTANATPEEIKLAKNKVHKLDITKEINRFLDICKIRMKTKKQPKSRPSERINWFKLSKISDGWMVKYEIEGFIHGNSMGTRPMKFYVSDSKKIEIEDFMDKFMSQYKSTFQDTRNLKTRNRPEKKNTRLNPEDLLLNLDDLWDSETLKKQKLKKEADEDKDVWSA